MYNSGRRQNVQLDCHACRSSHSYGNINNWQWVCDDTDGDDSSWSCCLVVRKMEEWVQRLGLWLDCDLTTMIMQIRRNCVGV